jgi:hypothetical protein
MRLNGVTVAANEYDAAGNRLTGANGRRLGWER